MDLIGKTVWVPTDDKKYSILANTTWEEVLHMALYGTNYIVNRIALICCCGFHDEYIKHVKFLGYDILQFYRQVNWNGNWMNEIVDLREPAYHNVDCPTGKKLVVPKVGLIYCT